MGSFPWVDSIPTLLTISSTRRMNQMRCFLHLVALYANMNEYGTENFLAEIVRIRLGTEIDCLACRCKAGGQDLSLPEHSEYRIFRLRTPADTALDGRY